MNFKEYQEKSRLTASYPGLNNDISYVLTGLMGEFGELCNKFKKILRDNQGVMSQERIDGIIGELGDFCWYLFQIYSELKIDFQDNYIEIPINHIEIKSVLNILGTMHCCISDIIIYCLCQNKTLISQLTNKSNALIVLIKEICKICNITIEEIMDKNIEKLKSRLVRTLVWEKEIIGSVEGYSKL